MNYNELLILHYMPHFKLFKTSHSQFLPFLSQKTLKIRRISHLLKNTVFFSVLFRFLKDEPKTRIKCNIMEMRFGKRLCWKYILQFPSNTLNGFILF